MIKNLNVFVDEDSSSHLSNGYCFKNIFDRTEANYNKYKLGMVEDFSDYDCQDMQVLETLERLGFPLNEIGTYFYKNMILKVIYFINQNSTSKAQLLEQMNNPFSQFYIDVARNDLDVGIKTFHSHIEDAFTKVKFSKADTSLLFELSHNSSKNINYGEYAFIIGEYLTTKKNCDKQQSVKQIKMVPTNIMQVSN